MSLNRDGESARFFNEIFNRSFQKLNRSLSSQYGKVVYYLVNSRPKLRIISRNNNDNNEERDVVCRTTTKTTFFLYWFVCWLVSLADLPNDVRQATARPVGMNGGLTTVFQVSFNQ